MELRFAHRVEPGRIDCGISEVVVLKKSFQGSHVISRSSYPIEQEYGRRIVRASRTGAACRAHKNSGDGECEREKDAGPAHHMAKPAYHVPGTGLPDFYA